MLYFESNNQGIRETAYPPPSVRIPGKFPLKQKGLLMLSMTVASKANPSRVELQFE